MFSPGFQGLNELTKRHNTTTTTRMQLSDRMPASLRFNGLNRPTKQHDTTTTTGMQLSDRRPA